MKLEDLTKEDLIKVIANIQNDNELNKVDSKTIKKVSNKCIKHCEETDFDLPKPKLKVSKLLKKLNKKYKKAKTGETIEVCKLERHNFNKELSTDIGFGYQDLKEDVKDLFVELTSLGHDFEVLTTNIDKENLEVVLNVKK